MTRVAYIMSRFPKITETFVLYEMLRRGGIARDDCDFAAVGATPQRWQSVQRGDHAATLTIEPFTSLARAAGFNVLDCSAQHFPAYQGGVVAWVAFWAFYGQGFGAENLASVLAFGGAYMLVVIIEPLADLAVLAAAKSARDLTKGPLFNARLHTGT